MALGNKDCCTELPLITNTKSGRVFALNPKQSKAETGRSGEPNH